MSEPVWPSGVGGAQCDDCGQTTIVRGFDPDVLGMPQQFLCRACVEGFDDDYFDDEDDDLGPGPVPAAAPEER